MVELSTADGVHHYGVGPVMPLALAKTSTHWDDSSDDELPVLTYPRRTRRRGHAYRSEVVLAYLPRDVDTSKITAHPGGLPHEIWCLILEAIDDSHTLFACGLTCKVLASWAKKMQNDRIRGHSNIQKDMVQLRLGVGRDQLVGELLSEIVVDVHKLSRFAFEFAGKLHSLRKLTVVGNLKPLWMLSASFFKAIARFSSILLLELREVVFWRFTDLTHLICTFPNLVHLTLMNTSWKGGPGRSLASEPFTRTLRLRRIEVTSTEDLTMFRNLLGASTLMQTLEDLLLVSVVDGGYYQMRTLLRAYGDETQSLPHGDLNPSASLLVTAQRVAEVTFDYFVDNNPFDQDYLLRGCAILDTFFTSSAASCLRAVNVVFLHLPRSASESFCRDPLSFLLLRKRGILHVQYKLAGGSHDAVDLIIPSLPLIMTRDPQAKEPSDIDIITSGDWASLSWKIGGWRSM